MNGIRQIFCKEMARIFRDKKMVFSVFLLPVIVMVAILTIINNLAGQMQSDIESHRSIVWVQNEPESFRAFREAAGLDCDMETVSSPEDNEKARAQILEGDADLLIEFPEDFDQEIAAFRDYTYIYYTNNPSEEYSSQAYQTISTGRAGSLPADAPCRPGGQCGRCHGVHSQLGQ